MKSRLNVLHPIVCIKKLNKLLQLWSQKNFIVLVYAGFKLQRKNHKRDRVKIKWKLKSEESFPEVLVCLVNKFFCFVYPKKKKIRFFLKKRWKLMNTYSCSTCLRIGLAWARFPCDLWSIPKTQLWPALKWILIKETDNIISTDPQFRKSGICYSKQYPGLESFVKSLNEFSCQNVQQWNTEKCPLFTFSSQ